jgi:hypothetical protein
MSTQGQGDGGVYFSTLGPASYDLGSEDYEKNIIVDCFGKERLEEYRGKHKLDVCLVYGVDPLIIEQAPGGRDNAKVVSKATFEIFGLPHADGSYFLRPDRLLGAFLLDPDPSIFNPLFGSEEEIDQTLLEEEKQKDRNVQNILLHYQQSAFDMQQYLKLDLVVNGLTESRNMPEMQLGFQKPLRRPLFKAPRALRPSPSQNQFSEGSVI